MLPPWAWQLLSLYLWQRRARRNGLIPSSFFISIFQRMLEESEFAAPLLLILSTWRLQSASSRRRRRKKCRQKGPSKDHRETCPPFFQWHFDECGPMWWILNLYKIFFNFKSSISFRYERKWATYDILLNWKRKKYKTSGIWYAAPYFFHSYCISKLLIRVKFIL